MTATPERCPECGAPRVGGLACWEQLGVLLAWEHDDPALQREHFLTVASYNLQHPARFTDDAIAGLREARSATQVEPDPREQSRLMEVYQRATR